MMKNEKKGKKVLTRVTAVLAAAKTPYNQILCSHFLQAAPTRVLGIRRFSRIALQSNAGG